MLTKGANEPLFFTNTILKTIVRTCWLIGSTIVFLSGCSHTPPKPTLHATGYLSDTSSVRVWRKDLNNIPVTIVSNEIPFDNQRPQIVTTYRYLDGSLSAIERRLMTSPEVQEQFRFNEQTQLTFNQRVYPDRKEMVEQETVEFLVYQAQQVLELSTVLKAGRTRLLQGTYQNNQLTTCAGEKAYLPLEQMQRKQVESYLKNYGHANLSWLRSPVGQQLILITEQDLCALEPTLESL